MKIFYLKILCILFIFNACNSRHFNSIKLNKTSVVKKTKPLSEEELKNWYKKDILIDTIPGISLNRAYDSIIQNTKGAEIIVAIIDTEIDIDHEDLKGQVWTNTDEIPNNNIDDDNNGFVDDINGWNFIGNQNGENIIFSNMESVRILQFFKKDFENKDKADISSDRKKEFELYIKAKKKYDDALKVVKADQKYGDNLRNKYPKAKEEMKRIFLSENYTANQLDSVREKYKESNKTLSYQAYLISDFIKYNLTEDWITDFNKGVDNKLNKTYNLNYIDRKKIDQYPHDLSYTNYGNPYVNKNIEELYHGTLIAGLIAANRQNDIGINAIAENVKIMPLAISSNGEEHDKDIALAIRYAVNNGAKVINMSFGKELSLHEDWIINSLKYAEKNEVLIITSSGNSGKDLNEHNSYPNDFKTDNTIEVVDNFLVVGSISDKLDQSLLSYFSDYGNKNVDVFAPGENIYTTLPNNNYKFNAGTSISCAITSGVAALVRSYYPDLTASEVKHILMDSGLEYTLEVSVPTKENKDRTIPFNQLSKSGKVINAYNALIMADSISKH